MNILHIDTEKTWRGGENQLYLLLKHGRVKDYQFHTAVPPDSAAAPRFAQLAPVVPVAMRGLNALPAVRALVRYCQDHKISIIDAHTSQAHGLALLVKAFLPNIKLAVHRRVDYLPGSDFLNRRKYLSPKVDRYIAISNAIKDILIQYGINSQKIAIARSAVPENPYAASNPFEMRRELGFIGETPLIACVAYFTSQKGHATLLRALRLLLDQHILAGNTPPPFHCILAGEGPLKADMEALTAELALQEYVRFLGVRDDVPKILAAADILAMPSNYEGLGTTILDGLHAGCAVVATNVGGIPEIIEHEKTGLLSPVGNAQLFGENLAAVLSNLEKRKSLATAGRQLVEREFSLEKMVAGNLAVYQQLLEG